MTCSFRREKTRPDRLHMRVPYILKSKIHVIRDWISAKIGTSVVPLVSFCIWMILGTYGLQTCYNGQYCHWTTAVSQCSRWGQGLIKDSKMTTMTPVRRERLNTLLVQASKVSVRAILQRRWPRQGQYLQKRYLQARVIQQRHRRTWRRYKHWHRQG